MDDDFDGTEIRVDEPTTSTATLSKRKRKREKEKANKQQNSTKKAKSSSDDEDGGVKLKPSKAVAEGKNDGSINEDIAKMDPSLLADYVGQRLKHWEKSLSSVELEDKYIPARVFADTTAYPSQRTLAKLPNYMEKFCRVPGSKKFRLDRASELKGAPHTLIITAAALRASHIASAVRKYQSPSALVAKLFAKHIKLAESLELCRTSRIGVGVGTPRRILELLKEDVLKLEELRWVIVDASYVDKKQFGVFDIRETQKGLMEILNHEGVRARFEAEGGAKLLFF